MQIWSAYFLKARNRPYLSKSSELLFLGCFFQKQKLKKIQFFATKILRPSEMLIFIGEKPFFSV